jgi:hypothetical protein
MMQLADKLEEYRVQDTYLGRSPVRAPYGAFDLPGPCGARLRIIACNGRETGVLDGWEHVSVSTDRRIPNWTEMCFVKNLFWPPEDCVVQYHPPASDYINVHPHVLHLWRPIEEKIPMPPRLLV